MSSSQPTSTTTSAVTTSSSDSSNSNNQVEAVAVEGGQGEGTVELPSTLEAALSKIEELKSKRDQLLAQKEKSTKEIEKLTKRTRMETLKSLVPRQLYRTEDKYNEELEKVYSWKNISDQEIADIYNTKLRAIDLGKRIPKQHGSSIITQDNKYTGFRSVPEFRSAATKIQQAASDNAKLFSLMKKIAGSSNN
jgi:hypothetical protein